MKSKFNYLGQVEDIHLFQEIPDGQVKDVDGFGKYMRYFNRLTNGKSFLDEILSRSDFIRSWITQRSFTIKENK